MTFHSVPQRHRDGIEGIGGGDEHDIAEIKSHIKIVISKLGILFGIEHFQQRRAGIAAEVAPQFVDFVQHDQGIARFGAPYCLDDPPRHRADIGAAETAYLGFIANAAEAHADELPAIARAIEAPQ